MRRPSIQLARGALHGITRRRSLRGASVAIVLPADPGSLGDEAMLRSACATLAASGVAAITAIGYETLDGLDRDGFARAFTLAPFRPRPGRVGMPLVRELMRFDRVYLLGADVLDGAYSVEDTLLRLNVARAARAAGSRVVLTGFSFRASVPAVIIETFRRLPADIEFRLRDPASYANFTRLTGSLARSFADLAFVALPRQSPLVAEATAWADAQRRASRYVLGLNLSTHAAARLGAAPLAAHIAAVVGSLARDRALSLVLVPHDHRSLNGLDGDAAVLRLVAAALPGDLPVLALPGTLTSGEAAAIATTLDACLTARMHLAIACMAAATPVLALSYGEKFGGPFAQAGVSGWLLPATIEDGGQLAARLRDLIGEAPAVRQLLRERVPALQRLAAEAMA